MSEAKKPVSSNKPPAMPLYGKDFYDDEHVQLMTLEQQGAYMRLLWHSWSEGSIPADLEEIALLLRLPYETEEDENLFARKWRRIAPCWRVAVFDGIEDAKRLQNDRVERERAKYVEFSAKQSAKGKASAMARAAKSNHGSTTVQPANGPEMDGPHEIGHDRVLLQIIEPDTNRGSTVVAENPTVVQPQYTDGLTVGEPPNSQFLITSTNVDGEEPPPPPANNPVWNEVNGIQCAVFLELDWGEPQREDVTRYLKPSSPIRKMAVQFGADRTVRMFCWAARNWTGTATWEAVYNQRNQLAQDMIKAPRQRTNANPAPPIGTITSGISAALGHGSS